MYEDITKEIKDAVEIMGKTFEEAVNNDFYIIVAKAYRKLYLNLVTEGFSGEEAMAICTSQGLGVNAK